MEHNKKAITKLQTKSQIQNIGEVCNEEIRLAKVDERFLQPKIKSLIDEKGFEAVEGLVLLSIKKCASALQINLSDIQSQTLAEDLLDVYKWESIQDINEALKRGRQGEFGANYKQLNMIVVREWMRVVLDDKAALREKAKNNEKKDDKNQKPFNKQEYYENYLRVEREKKAANKKKTLSDMQFEAKKHEYFKNRK